MSASNRAIGSVDADAVDEATKRLDGVSWRTPLEPNARLSELVGGDVWLKREDLQVVRSYKLRGAYNLIAPERDTARTVAGQGTVATEIADQLGVAPDLVVVPVGGGGLLAGMAVWSADRQPGTSMVGVEPAGAACMQAALAAGHPTPLDELEGCVDGAAVRTAANVTFPLVRDHAHYFLVDFSQEPGALRRFLRDVVGPGRRHHAVRVREAQQPGAGTGTGRHRAADPR